MLRRDKSKKGAIDEDIRPLLAVLNRRGHYETTSSCSGRIVLLDVPKTGDKQHAQWLYTAHTKADPDAIESVLRQQNHEIWFLQEPVILHVNCMTLADAERLLELAKSCGFKRSGIFSLKHFSVELQGTERMETLLTRDLPKEYIARLAAAANLRLQRTKKKIQMLLERLQTPA